MTAPIAPDLDVLVVGAGPTGLTAACELTRRGARCLAIDRAPEPSSPGGAAFYRQAFDVAPPGLSMISFPLFQGLSALATRPGPSGANP